MMQQHVVVGLFFNPMNIFNPVLAGVCMNRNVASCDLRDSEVCCQISVQEVSDAP